MNSRQISLFNNKPVKAFGGSLRKGTRKLARPITTKKTMHLVLRAQILKPEWNMLSTKHRNTIEKLIYKKADENDIKIDQFANVGNHIHMIIMPKTRTGFKRFLRTITGRIATIVTGAKKGSSIKPQSTKRHKATEINPVSKKSSPVTKTQRKFWLQLAFTRVLEWGVDLLNTRLYITKNKFEGEGIQMWTSHGYRKFKIRDGTLLSLTAT